MNISWTKQFISTKSHANYFSIKNQNIYNLISMIINIRIIKASKIDDIKASYDFFL